MEREEILKKAQKKKVYIGEMEKEKVNKANWIALIVAQVLAVALMIIEGCLKHFSAIYAIAMVCMCWAMVLYFCQFFIAKRPKGVLIGAVLYSIGFSIMSTFYVLFSIGVL